MKDGSIKPIYLTDYLAPNFLIDSTELSFKLESEYTSVGAKIAVRKNPASPSENSQPDLVLDGGRDLELVTVKLNGSRLGNNCYSREGETLTIFAMPDQAVVETLVHIKPHKNTSLNGLYKSRGMYCTQCEAQGFREITFYLDRPDILSEFTTHVIADREEFPVLLSNGNKVSHQQLDGGRHQVTWHDPFKKPSYLFALVGGKLSLVEDYFVTCSDRSIALQIFVEEKDTDKCDHAMQSLKKAMRWDEQIYGREYDLDVFMIVAVDDFNMGAMENKGLNIFNTQAILANPDITKDDRFQLIEAIVAHEYFHNWSGNRVTCRDWFQLSLKEGFTVFRDAQFSADMNSPIVKRIEDARLIRTHQFAEDSGPMAHPVQPDSYIEINNFYTLTVYEKGAEIVGMLHSLLGKQVFRQATDLYFDRHDGEAVTIEDFVSAMEDASGRDLKQFRHWYKQSGTPVIDVESSYREQTREFKLKFRQSCPDTPGQQNKEPFLIPIRFGLLDEGGADVVLNSNGDKETLLELVSSSHEILIKDVPPNSVPSLLRGFSAPVKINYPYNAHQLAHLMRYDTDGFNRWDAGQQLSTKILHELISDSRQGKPLKLDANFLDVLREILSDSSLDDAVAALMVTLPGEALLHETADVVYPLAIHESRYFTQCAIAASLKTTLEQIYHRANTTESYRPDSKQIGRRNLKNTALRYLVLAGSGQELAWKQFREADNMTDMASALTALIVCPGGEEYAKLAIDQFEDRWREETLAMNLWFRIQSENWRSRGLERVQKLMSHPLFSMKNPNKVGMVIGAYCHHNLVNFHECEGSGYNFLAQQILELNQINPQVGANLVTPLTNWRKYASPHGTMMRDALEKISSHGSLSKDIHEIVSKSL